MPQETILIKFKPEGDKELIQAINALGKAQIGLVNSQAKVAKANKDSVKAQLELARAGRIAKQTSDDLARQRKKEEIATIKNKDAIRANKLQIKQEDAARKKVLSTLKADILARNRLAAATKGATAATAGATKASGILSTRNKRLAKTNGMLANSFATLRSKLLLISFGAMLIERAFVSLVKAYGRQEAANEKLRVGLGNVQDTTEGVTQRLVDYSAALQQTTAFGDEMITTGMVQFTTFGLNEKAIKALTPQVLNVARAIQTVSGTMPDLNSLFIAFGKATTTGIGTLTRYGVVLTDAERAQLKNMDASESAVAIGKILERQYGGLAEAYAKTTSGMLEAADAARGDAAEAFGKVLAPTVLAVSKGLKLMFEAMTPARIGRMTTAVLAFAGAFGTAKLAVILYSGAMKTAAVATLNFGKALMRNPIFLLASAFSIAAVAVAEYFGVFDEEPLTDAQKRQLELIESTSKLAEAQDKGAEKLQNQLDLLNAKTEVDKMLIQLGHEASDTERELIDTIIAKTQAIKDEAQALKDLERVEKSTASLHDQALLLRMENAGVDEKLIALKELQVEGQNALNKEMLGFVEIDARNIENIKLTVEGTETLTGKQQDYLNALHSVLLEKMKLIITGDEEITQLATLHDVYAETYSAISDIVTANQNRIMAGIKEQNNAEISELKKTTKYKNATSAQQEKMEADIKKKREKEFIKAFRMQQAAQIGQVWMNIALAAARQFADMPLPAAMLAQPALLAIGAIQSAAILAQSPPKMERGGIIGGRRHSQGGTMINAEQGEFIVKRDAVANLGIPMLQAINAGDKEIIKERVSQFKEGGLITNNIVERFKEGGLVTNNVFERFEKGGTVERPPINISNMLPTPDMPTAAPAQITVNVSGNVMSQDFVEGELSEQIREAVRRGTDFGIS